MSEPKKKPARRLPGPKSKPTIPANFRISRQISPMAMILNEAEAEQPIPLQEMNPVQDLQGAQNLNPVQDSQPLQNLHPVQNLSQPQISEPVQELKPVQFEPAINLEPAVKVEAPSKTKPAYKFEPGAKTEPGKGFLQIPNDILDNVFPLLDHVEVVIYIRLYRLSYGFGKTTCQVSIPTLATRCNCSENTTRSAIRKLASRGLIHIQTVSNTGAKDGGTIFEVYSRFEGGSNSAPGTTVEPAAKIAGGSKVEPGSRSEPIKDHDHEDLKIHDHHQSETMTIYQSITGNRWGKKDQEVYSQLKEIPVEVIEQGIRIIAQRAPQKPGSLAYFVKGIVDLYNAGDKAPVATRAQLKAIIERLRTAHAGGKYPISELSEDVKRVCAKDGVIFDHELFNEIIS